MSEGMHSTNVRAGKRSRNRLLIIAASTTLAVVGAAVAIQFFRAQPGTAGEDAGTASTGSAATRPRPVTQGPGEVVARVGNKAITRQEVEAEAARRYWEPILDKMINRTIIEQACQQRGVEVTQAEVKAEVEIIAKRFNLDVQGWLSMLQAERNISPSEYAHDIIWPMLALKKLAGSEVVVTEDDIKKAFIRDFGPRVECKMIMLDNIRRAQEVWQKAGENPEEFGRLAREHSIEPTSRALEGDVPPIRAYSGNDAIEKAAFKLKKDEISGIVEVGTPQAKRYVILYCKGRTAQVVTDIEKVRDELYKQLKEEKTQEAVAKVFEQIKEEIRVDNYVKSTTSGGAQAEAGIQRTSGSTRAPEGVAPRTGAAPRSQPR